MLSAPSDNVSHEDKALPKKGFIFCFKIQNEKKLTLTREKNREKKTTLIFQTQPVIINITKSAKTI